MANIIHIKDIKGVFSNADQEDIGEDLATVMQNFRSENGKIIKTFGFGDIFGLDVLDIIETAYWVDSGNVWRDGQYWVDSGSSLDKALDASIINLVTYFNQNASAGSGYGSGDGYVIIGLAISASTGTVTFYYWNGIDWANITALVKNTPDTFYHIYDKNPIVQSNEIIRFLPGGEIYAGTGSAIHQPTGVWLGWIDRDYFDELYVADTDYDSGFYLYNLYPTRPDISTSGLNATAAITAGGTFMSADGSRWYKISYVYDGINESLLSEEIKVTYTDNTFLLMTLTFSTTTFNKRITAINVYRSTTGNIGDASDEIDGSYERIHSIDLTRDPSDVTNYSGTQARSGLYFVYIPDIADGIDLTKAYYAVKLAGSNSDYYRVQTPTSANQKIFFIIKKWTYTGIIGIGAAPSTASTFDEDYNSCEWDFGYFDAYGDATMTSFDTDTTGAYAGDLFAFLDEGSEFANGVLANSNLMLTVLTTVNYRVISTNYKRAVRYGTAISGFNTSYYTWQLLTVNSGLYYFDESGTTKYCYFFDTELTEGAAYPLLNQPSIQVNCEQAIYNLNRLWQINGVLDPGATGKNEEHVDWLSYSELDQPDVNPVSNVIKISDNTGGEATGLATSFGSLIILKKNSVHKLKIPDIADPTSWRVSESVFNRGCIAKKGYIQVGHQVYFASTDGIYKLDVNFEAASDDTPLLQNRISEQINDVLLALNDISEKPYITCGYDKIKTEIIFRLTSTAIWAFNVTTKMWREIDTAKTCDIFAYDQNDDLMVFNESDDSLYTINEETFTGESVGCCVATKFFNITGYTGGRLGLIRSASIRYLSAVALIVRCYLNGSTTVAVYDELAPALTSALWDTVAGWDLSGSTLNHNSAGAGAITPVTVIPVIAGQVYKVVITLSACTVGTCSYTLGGTTGTSLAAATTYTDYLIAATTGDLTFTPSATTARFTISAVSVKQIYGGSLAISSSITTVKMAMRLRAHSFKVEIVDLTSSTSNSEIYNIKLEVD